MQIVRIGRIDIRSKVFYGPGGRECTLDHRQKSFEMLCLSAYLPIYMTHELYETLGTLIKPETACKREIGVYWYLFSNQDIARLIPEG